MVHFGELKRHFARVYFQQSWNLIGSIFHERPPDVRSEVRHEVNKVIDDRPLVDQNVNQHQRGFREALTTGCVQFLLTSPCPTSRISSNSSRHRDVSGARQHQFCPVRDRGSNDVTQRLWCQTGSKQNSRLNVTTRDP